MYKTIYTLPTRSRMNPVHPETALYWCPGQVIYVVAEVYGHRVNPRVITSFGELTGIHVGTNFDAVHDQTNRSRGYFTVIGIRHADGSLEGEVPDKSLGHAVVK